MSKPEYHYRTQRHNRRRRILKIITLFILLLAAIAAFILYDLYKNRSRETQGQSSTVLQTTTKDPHQTFEEPTFTIDLPVDWKEIERVDNEFVKSVTWHATLAKEDNRWLTVYVDKIPRDKPLNRIVPVDAQGQFLQLGNMSDECPSFTTGTADDPSQIIFTKPKLTRWEHVEFICNLPRPHENETGTSSKDGVNIVTVEGPESGKHSYFFVFTDHNKQFKPQLFTEALNSFKAK